MDNTLWDWLHVWFESYRAMLAKVTEISGVPLRELLPEIQEVQRRHGTSEYAFLIQELSTLKRLHPNEDLLEVYSPAIEAYRRARREHLHLYESVGETLSHIRATGCLLVGYTESREFYTNYRLRATGLDKVLDYVYYPRDHELPEGTRREALRHYNASHYELAHTKVRYTPMGAHKPAPEVLESIIQEIGADRSGVVYVGDSLRRDILMAKRAGVTDVLAAYGVAERNSDAYRLLERVSYMGDSDVEAERVPLDQVRPTYRLDTRFSEIIRLFDFDGGAPVAAGDP